MDADIVCEICGIHYGNLSDRWRLWAMLVREWTV